MMRLKDFMEEEFGWDENEFEWFGNMGYSSYDETIYRLYPKFRDGVIREFTLDASTIKTQPIHHIDLKLSDYLRLDDDDNFHDIYIVQSNGEISWSCEGVVDTLEFVEAIDTFIGMIG